jgi:hypothetical protein
MTEATEQLVQKSGLSAWLPSLPSFSGLPAWLSGSETVTAAAETAANATAETTAAVTGEAATSFFNNLGTPAIVADVLQGLQARLPTQIFTPIRDYFSFVTDVSWVGDVASVAATSAAINVWAAKRIPNPYVRNVVSGALGATVVWGAKLALSSVGCADTIPFANAVDIAARTTIAATVLKWTAPLASGVVRALGNTVNFKEARA